MYKISVITPVYKAEKYIGNCCKYLFEQSFQDVEFIFVNDATPDNSIRVLNQVLERYPMRKEHVRIAHHSKNAGVAAARNTGLSMANGQYVLFVDADDRVEREMMNDLYAATQNGMVDIIGFDWYLEFETNRRYLKQPVYEKVEDCLNAMLAGQLRWYLWAFMVRKSLYDANNLKFIPGLNVGEDMMMLIKLFSLASSYCHISRPLYYYAKCNASSLTQIKVREQIMIVERNADEAIRFIKNKYGAKKDLYLNYMKLNLKYPLLYSDDCSNYELWNSIYTEANAYVCKNPYVSFRCKLVQWMASKRQYWFLIIYYRFLFKFIYGVIYK